MNTVITILAIIVLVIVIIIAISGSRNLRNFHDNMDKTFDNAWKDAGKYMETLILKSNSKKIRQTLRKNHIKVCRCAAFPNSLWLDYNDSVTNLVHRVGYSDETCPATPEQVIRATKEMYNN